MKKILLTFVVVAGQCLAGQVPAYTESLRPGFHFTARDAYINDPNGLFYLDGTYHMMFQHGKSLATKTWGHAVGDDLLHWKQLDDAIPVDDGKYPAFSGSAFVDTENKSGLGVNGVPPVLAMYTAWGKGQCLAYSTDGGNTFIKHPKNPILKLPNDEKKNFLITARDPEIFWHEPTEKWVMILYQNLKAIDATMGQGYFTSDNLIDWKFESHQTGYYVCPDLFQLPINGDMNNKKWVALDWEKYKIGEFDGKTFVPETDFIRLDQGPNQKFSANQTWENLSDNEKYRVQIAWLRGGKYPGMPFDQQMTFPCKLELVQKKGGSLRLQRTPVPAISKLYVESITRSNLRVSAEKPFIQPLNGEFYDIFLNWESTEQPVIIDVLGHHIRCAGKEIKINKYETTLDETTQSIRLLIDRSSLELFINEGAAVITLADHQKPDSKTLRVSSQDQLKLKTATIHRLKSIWE